MAEVKTEQEPSIEEILESIRQIISEDTEEPAKQAAQTLEAVKEPAPVPSNLSLTPKPEAPVPPSNLSLTPAAPAPAAPAAPAPKPAAPAAPAKAPPLDLTEKVAPAAPAPAVTQPSPIAIEMMDSPMTNNSKEADLVSAETATAVTDSLSKILASNVAVETERAGAVGKVTLEDLARDLMKPLIKTWLDQNLPGIIEKAVQREVEKLSRRVMDR